MGRVSQIWRRVRREGHTHLPPIWPLVHLLVTEQEPRRRRDHSFRDASSVERCTDHRPRVAKVYRRRRRTFRRTFRRAFLVALERGNDAHHRAPQLVERRVRWQPAVSTSDPDSERRDVTAERGTPRHHRLDQRRACAGKRVENCSCETRRHAHVPAGAPSRQQGGAPWSQGRPCHLGSVPFPGSVSRRVETASGSIRALVGWKP